MFTLRFRSEHGRSVRRLRADVVVADPDQIAERRDEHRIHHGGRVELGGFAGHAGRGHRTDIGRRAAGPVRPEEHDPVEHGTVGHLVDRDCRDERPVRAVRGPRVGRNHRRDHFHRCAHVYRRNR